MERTHFFLVKSEHEPNTNCLFGAKFWSERSDFRTNPNIRSITVNIIIIPVPLKINLK